MEIVFRKTRKHNRRQKTKNRHRAITKSRQRGGASGTARISIKYKTATSDDTSSYIQLVSPGVVDWTDNYNLKRLDKEPLLEIMGLDAGKKYLLVMTDPNALGKTWTHWVVIVNGAGQIVKPAIAEYSKPSPPAGSGVHHYIFRFYDMAVVGKMPSPLLGMSRGVYFAVKLKKLLEGKQVLAEATFTIDSNKIKNGKQRGVMGNVIGVGLDALR
jgi:phosphatidylethanolamine-binding protein (PEBP) family uncharacterized protein